MPSDKFQLSREVLIKAIRPALVLLEAGGLAAEQLVLGTGIQESLLVSPAADWRRPSFRAVSNGNGYS